MRERVLVVQRDKAREVVKSLVSLGLKVCVVGHLPRTDLILGNEIFPGAVEQKVLLKVSGEASRQQLKSIPGVVRVRSKTSPRKGPVVTG